MQVNAMIQDEHTMIHYITPDQFPFDFYWFEEGLYVIRTSEDNKGFLWSKLVAVNNIPVSYVVDKIVTLMPDKNPQNIKKEVGRYLADPFVLHGLQISPSRRDVSYTLVGLTNDTMKTKPVAIDLREVKLTCACENKHFFKDTDHRKNWFRFINDSTIYFKYSTCHEDEHRSFKKMAEELISSIDDKKSQKIIIDMRDNGGGYPGLLAPFINSLAMSKLNKRGRIYVLIGRNTFSAGIINAVTIKDKTYAKLVGEETSGSTSFFGGVETFVLPETKLKIRYSTGYVATSENYDGSLKPDVLIPVTFADYDKGIDAALEYALHH